MRVESDAELFRLRGLLSDLVALSAIPSVWVERSAGAGEPGTEAVAAGLADALVGLLQLDFAFVRLSDPAGAGAADATRGDAWNGFPEWLESQLAAGTGSAHEELTADVGDERRSCRGVAIPIGLDGGGGVVAAACERSDFPTATDHLLLSFAASQAATAFESARLVHERRTAEQQRAAELRRSEAYLAEGQALTHAGSFALDVFTRETTHSSDEHSRLYGFDRAHGLPSLNEFLQRIHPEDRPACIEALERGIREATTVEVEYRVVLPDGPIRRHRAIAHPFFGASGELDEFVGTIMDVTERRRAERELERLAGEQAALRRVATLVARDASQAEVFTAIAEEIGRLLGAEEIRMLRYEADHSAVVVANWGRADDLLPIGSRLRLEDDSTTARVFRTGQPARIDDYARVRGPMAEKARSGAIGCVVGTPIRVEGRLWGAMTAGTSRHAPLPPETESRLGQFTDLMATAIANTESHARADRLAEEQAALRRVATLVAKEASPAEVFARVAEEVASVLGDVDCSLVRDEGDGTGSAVAIWGRRAANVFPVGARLPLDGDGVLASVLRHGRPYRIDDYSAATGAIGERARDIGIRSAVGCPIVVGGRTWGAMAVASYAAEPFPPETESRVAQFSELVATAIANAAAHAEVERLAEEQAALRRVATLVAEGATPTAVLDAVAAEMERLLRADGVTLSRYEPGAEVTVVAHRGPNAWRLPAGARVSHEGENVTTMVRLSEQPARMEEYAATDGALADLVRTLGVRVAVGAPIVVDGRLWGVVVANWTGGESPPADTEERMSQFAQLLDSAIANADSRAQLMASRSRLLTAADEARRRVVRDLHDGTQQRLVHAIVTLKLARQALRERDEKAEALVAEALQHAEQGKVELRELAHGILPAALTRGGLRAGVNAIVTRLDVPVEAHVPAGRFPAEVEASAYFVVAEALTNVVKHAHAGRAEVRASAENGRLHVEIRDDGIGGADPAGHGLVGMGDRVTALGGRLRIESPGGGGTLVAATLPLSGG